MLAGTALLVLAAFALPARAQEMAPILRAAFTAIAERHLEPTDPVLVGLWALRGLEAIDPYLSAARREQALVLSFSDQLSADRLAGNTPQSAADAVAALYAEAERQSPALRRAGRQAMLQAGFEEVFNHLDPYSRYTTPEEARQGRERRLGASDLGLTLIGQGRRGIAVGEVTPDGAAARAGLRPGDRLLDADGIAISVDDVGQALSALEGPPGSSLLLTVQRGRRRLQLVLTRRASPRHSVSAEVRNGILWLQVPLFSTATPAQLDRALGDVPAEAAPLGVVLDLRGNRGGLLQQAIQVADSFITSGTLAATEGRHPDSIRRFNAKGTEFANGRPLVVLVDGRTASAAEVVAAAIGDHGRGVVIGSTTMGKGLIQVLVPLPNGAELALSWSLILAPRGWPLQMLGVLPAVCTSRGEQEMARNLATLGTRDDPMAVPLARARAARAPVPMSEVAALRNACPPSEGRDADRLAAQAVLERPELYRAALAR
ncbi:S41 family peptidase [Roseomonas xinghualingensis]|uniref:S41 family peptidase n=1 Tax=Roseomonas xinghualingensis TaxID=2986475 RepID=UPI0021F1B9B7|nr:S41 family peptidase [Roseomonas sp. SXEYE001]MCV4209594.1 S41 family peptidase [Roseomonas sp. SXEYE001]